MFNTILFYLNKINSIEFIEPSSAPAFQHTKKQPYREIVRQRSLTKNKAEISMLQIQLLYNLKHMYVC